MNSDNYELNIKKDIHILRIKSIITGCRALGFEQYLKEYLNLGVSRNEIFQDVILKSLAAVEYAVKEKDADILKLLNLLRKELDKEVAEEAIITKSFIRLLEKARSVCEGGSNIKDILNVFEFREFGTVFKEKIAPKNDYSDYIHQKHPSFGSYSEN